MKIFFIILANYSIMAHITIEEEIVLKLQIIIKDVFLNDTPFTEVHLGEMNEKLDDAYFILKLDEKVMSYHFDGDIGEKEIARRVIKIENMLKEWLDNCFFKILQEEDKKNKNKLKREKQKEKKKEKKEASIPVKIRIRKSYLQPGTEDYEGKQIKKEIFKYDFQLEELGYL